MLLALSVGGYLLRISQTTALESAKQRESQRVGSIIAGSALDAIISEDRPVLETVVTETGKRDESIVSIDITNEDGQVLAAWRAPSIEGESPTTDILRTSETVSQSGSQFGEIHLAWDMSQSREAIERTVRHLRWIWLGTLGLLALLIGLFGSLLVTRPITSITDRLRRLADRDYETGKPLRAARELTLLDSAVDSLGDELSTRDTRENELEKARIQAETASRAKDDFLANMSHEIRTPMNGIIGVSDLLAETRLTDEQVGLTEMIRSSGEHLLEVLNDILDFSKIESGKLDIERQEFSIIDCLEVSMAAVVTSASDKKLELSCDLDPALPVWVMGDRLRLRQIVTNLLTNAVKFTSDGEVSLKAFAAENSEGVEKLRITVRDTGPGIPEEDQRRLFESFTQLDASTTRKHGGTGLGLAISRRLTELMGGKLSIESQVGQGSEFTIELPLDSGKSGDEMSELPGIENLAGKRVLIVDDNTTNRRIIALLCESLKMKTFPSAGGKEALESLENDTNFDIAVVDMLMPEMDGLTLATKIRANPQTKNIKLLLATSLWKLPLGRAEGNWPFDAHTYKPLRRNQFARSLIRVINPEMQIEDSSEPEASPELTMPDPSRTRILIAEDNSLNQQVAIKLLARLGYRAEVANDGGEAVSLWEIAPHDLIFMDIQMPVRDGFEATREIRLLEKKRGVEHPPVIISMTANALKGDRERCLEAGMDDYMSKPIRIERLREALASLAKRRPDLATDSTSGFGSSTESRRGMDKDRLVDFEQFDMVCEDSPGASSIYQEFTKRVPDSLWQLGEAFERDESPEDIIQRAHKVRGIASNLGFVGLSRSLAHIEELARNNDLEEGQKCTSGLMDIFRQSRRLLEGDEIEQ